MNVEKKCNRLQGSVTSIFVEWASSNLVWLFQKNALDKWMADEGITMTQAEFKTLLFALCYFHAVATERRHFGAQGWNRTYPFSAGDLTISVNVLLNYIEGSGSTGRVPWEGNVFFPCIVQVNLVLFLFISKRRHLKRVFYYIMVMGSRTMSWRMSYFELLRFGFQLYLISLA